MKNKERSPRWICDIIKDEHYEKKMKVIKSQYGSVQARGRHPNRKAVAWAMGFELNFCGDMPVRYARIVALYRR